MVSPLLVARLRMVAREVNRRAFMQSMLAAGVAPYIGKAGLLMPGRGIIVPSHSIFAEPLRVVNGPIAVLPDAQVGTVINIFNNSHRVMRVFPHGSSEVLRTVEDSDIAQFARFAGGWRPVR